MSIDNVSERTKKIEFFMLKYLPPFTGKETMFSIGCGSGKRENYLSKHFKRIDCINHPLIYAGGGWGFNPAFKANKKLNFSVTDFITTKINKKYDIIFSSESLQFILNTSYENIDKGYFKLIENKLNSMLNPKGFIVITMIQKKFFVDRNKTNDRELNNKYFISSLTDSINVVKKMNFTVIAEKYFQNWQMKLLILQKK